MGLVFGILGSAPMAYDAIRAPIDFSRPAQVATISGCPLGVSLPLRERAGIGARPVAGARHAPLV
jgi:hypothetical protein